MKYVECTVFTDNKTKVYWELTGDQVLHLVTEKQAELYLELRHQKPHVVQYFDKQYEVVEKITQEGFFNI